MSDLTEYERALTFADDPRMARAPVWAQDHIVKLVRLLHASREQLVDALLQTDPDGSDAVLHPYGHRDLGTSPVGLGQRADIAYRVLPWDRSPPGTGRIHAGVSDDGRCIELRSSQGGLIVQPVGYNSIRVGWER